MKFNTLPGRVAATGAVTALAAGALVGLTTTSAHADPVDVNYVCDTALGPIPLSLTTDIPALGLASAVPLQAGQAVAAGSVSNGVDPSVTNHFTISDAVKQALQGVGTSKIDFTDFGGALGTSVVGADLPDVTLADLDQNEDTSWSFDADGPNLAFHAPAAGTYDVLAPATFAFDATTAGGTSAVVCTAVGTPGDYGHQITVIKNASKTKGSSNTPVKHGAKAVIKAKVTASNHRPTGKVTFKQGTKKLGTASLKKGVAKLTLKLSKGTHKIKAYYAGDGYTSKSTSAVFKVVQK